MYVATIIGLPKFSACSSRSFSSTRLGRPVEKVVQGHVARTIGELQDVPDVLAERASQLRGLRKKRGGAGHKRVLEPAAGLVCGQDDDRDVLERGLRADLPDELDAVVFGISRSTMARSNDAPISIGAT